MKTHAASSLLSNGTPITASDLVQVANLDTPNNPPTLDADGAITGTIVQRHGTAAQIDAITLEDGEWAWTTDTKELRIGDGVTPGGLFVAAKEIIEELAEEVTIASSTTFQTIGATIAYAASARYEINGAIHASDAGAVSNWKFKLFGSTTWEGAANGDYNLRNVLRWDAVYNDDTLESGANFPNFGFAASLASKSISVTSASKSAVKIWFRADINTDTAGTFAIQAAQSTSSASGLLVGMNLRVRRIA